MIDALTAANPVKNTTLLTMPVEGNKDSDRLANRLTGRVAKKLLAGFVPTGDGAIEIHAQNGVVIIRSLYNQRNKLRILIGTSALGNIEDGSNPSFHSAPLVPLRRVDDVQNTLSGS